MKIRVNGIGVNYRLEGPAEAPVVMLSHALAADLSMWNPQMNALTTGYRVLRYDTRGHGGTDAPAGPYSLEQRLKALTLTGSSRLKALPDVATFTELGVKGSYIDNWVGCFAATGTPKPAVELLAGAAEKVIKSKEFGERVEKGGGVVHPLSAREFQSQIEADKKVATETAKEVGIGIYQKAPQRQKSRGADRIPVGDIGGRMKIR